MLLYRGIERNGVRGGDKCDMQKQRRVCVEKAWKLPRKVGSKIGPIREQQNDHTH